MPKATLGQKVGARKVDADSYIPEPGNWEETNVIYSFNDGWLICEDRTEYDRRLMAHLTLTCLASMIPQCLPFDQEAYKRAMAIKTRQQYETPYYAQNFEQNHNNYPEYKKFKTFDDWLDSRVEQAMKEQPIRPGMYKFLHLRDPEARPRCAILMATSESLLPANRNRYGGSYTTSRDLGKQSPILLDGVEFELLEFRLGTGKHPPKIAEKYVVTWYKQAVDEWNEIEYQDALKRRPQYTAVRGEATLGQLAHFRKDFAYAGA